MSGEISSPALNVEAPQPLAFLFSAEGSPYLAAANAVGQGFNVYGELGLRSLKRPLLDRTKAREIPFEFLGKEFMVPSYILPVVDTHGSYFGGTHDSREDFQNAISAHAEVEVSSGFFSGEMKASFASELATSSRFTFSFKHLVAQFAYLSFDPSQGLAALDEDFKARVRALPAQVNADNLHEFFPFFEDFGGYYTRRVTLGGSLRFSVAVSQESKLSKEEISAMMKAQYDGLFTKGSLAADVARSTTWKSYAENSRTDIRVVGGDPSTIAALIGISPLDPSGASVKAYKDWLDSAKSAPAISDFALEGIWTLCGDRRGAVQKAWKMYTQLMHLRLTVRTRTAPVAWTPWPPKVDPAPPLITMGRSLQPSTPPASFCGFQLAILAPERQVNDPFSVRLDKYYTVEVKTPWAPVYPAMYRQIEADLRSTAREGDLVILSSFGLDYHMVVPSSLAGLLQSVGADRKLQDWLEKAKAGYESNGWISSPTNYALVGFMGRGTGTGIEAMSWAYQKPASLSLDVYLFRESLHGRFTLGV